MTVSRSCRLVVAVGLVVAGLVVPPHAQVAAPPPAPDPGGDANVFYGAAHPSSSPKSATLVFVHGLNGTASDWWLQNDMYEMAYNAGYRTAFVSLSPDNSRNNGTIAQNAAVLQAVLPRIAQRFQAGKLYLVGHSKGAIDVQAALLNPTVVPLVKAVFTISAPNTGTELADWALDHPELANALGLATPAVAGLRTGRMAQFRLLVDPILRQSGIPFYTLAGTMFLGNPFTTVTGAILRSLTTNINNDTLNDGMVTVARTRLPATYSADLGAVATNHFRTYSGSASFHKIRAVISGLELTFQEFERIATDGFSEQGGDKHNGWAWSMKWFKGQLYVGTARENLCVSIISSDVRGGTNYYPLAMQSTQCPDYSTLVGALAAEIWRYTVETKQWERVFKSPDEIPVVDGQGNPTLTARDIGFRGMEVFVESDGTEALYVGTVTSGSFLEPAPFQPYGYPPPRILRTTDGSSWAQLPQTPGTFLGEAGNILVNGDTKYRSFRSLQSYGGKLFATLGDFVGVGPVIASANPAAGDDAWYFAGPSARDDFPVWDLAEFNGFLYATTGLTRDLDPDGPGYAVYKTDATGPPPYTWTPVVTEGGNQSNRDFQAPNGLSMTVFKEQLYVGTNRPTELIRINPDDTWELLVGEPRMTPQGLKAPLSGMGNGFGSWFNGHFWRMAAWQDDLYLLTWDWSVALSQFTVLPFLDQLFASNYGFNIYRTSDGIHWTALTTTGLGDPDNEGGRSIEATPFGLFIGTVRQQGGLQAFRTDGRPPDPLHLPPPGNLTAASESVVGRTVALTWDPSPGAVRYQVYRALVIPLSELLGGQTISVVGPDGTPINMTYREIQEGRLDGICAGNIGDTTPCALIDAIRQHSAPAPQSAIDVTAFPMPFQVVAISTETAFTEPAPTRLQSIYFVRAEDNEGNLSLPSNIVGGPSKAAPAPVMVDRTPPELRAPHRVAKANDPGVCSALIRRLGQPDATDDVEIASVVNDAPADQRFSVGRTVVTWTATDTGGNASTDRQLVRVIDREPPRISALRLDRPLSLPRKPELEWVEAHVSYTLADNCSPTSALRVNLYVESAGAGVHARGRDQWNEHAESSQVASPLRVLLRADKGSRGFDAFYTITLRVRDEAGNAMSKSLSVKVPKWTHGR